jgi:Cu2+-exporting ATPase
MQDARIRIEGISCAACAVRIEDALGQIDGVVAARVDPATAELRIRYYPRRISRHAIGEMITRLGFRARDDNEAVSDRAGILERRDALKRLAVAWLGMTQTMMFALALYKADVYLMDSAVVGLLRYCSLIVAIPATLYAGWPIFGAGVAQLRRLQPGMDVPVSLGLLLALGASAWHTFRGAGPLYFDSAMMFVSFLGLARFVELTTRHQYGSATDALAAILPDHALVWRNDTTERVAPAELRPGDLVLIRRGERVPADSVVTEGDSSVDESLLTGESTPVRRRPGDPLIGGSLNLGASMTARVTAAMAQGELAGIVRLMERSRMARPRTLSLANRAARVFSTAILVLAAAVCGCWLVLHPEGAFEATVAVLVVACPCALALAAPVVNAAANGALARLGLLPISADAVEQLARVQTIIVDKTGTLTEGRPWVSVRASRDSTPADALVIAAALERHSAHPLATAFRWHEDPALQATGVHESPGQGLEGTVAGQVYRIGRPSYVAALHGGSAPDSAAGSCALGDRSGFLAAFDIADPLRQEARLAIAELQERGYDVEIASGDSPAVVTEVAAELGIAQWQARMTPAEKVALVAKRQGERGAVLMIGDGINDAPTLATASVSIALHAGSGLAHSTADLVMLDSAWASIPQALALARRSRQILRQNLAWAIAYNLAATPAAAFGFVPPWLAALGMSLSSLLVVCNARRVAGSTRRPPRVGQRRPQTQPGSRKLIEAGT